MKLKEQIISIKIEPYPDIRDRDIFDTDVEEIKLQKIKYPYEIFNTVTVFIETNKRKFDFNVYNGYYWNGADIIKPLWILVGSRYNPEFRIPSMVHDYILQFRKYILKEVLHDEMTGSEYRRLTSLIFRELLKKQGTNIIKSNIMSWTVDVFQHYFNRKQWNTI